MTLLKAYSVQEHDENTGDIFYARHAISARKAGANQYGDSEITRVSCRREPWADKYAPGPCPRLAMIDHGWWFECHGCGITLTCDGADEHEGDEEKHVSRNRFIAHGNAVYCSAECRSQQRAERAACKRLERRAIRDLATLIVSKLPDCTPITISQKSNWRPHAYACRQKDGSLAVQQCVVSFDWPGMKIGRASFRYDKVGEEPHLTVCHGDLEAWNAWRAACRTPSLSPQQSGGG